tara:strand:+ start:792 stop:1571 length:780 start_codon:yes stop_codon:yes gene_type:complete
MSCIIKSINYCPVKSLSFQSLNSSKIKKNLGMPNDRVFAFSRGVDLEKARLIEKNPNERKLNNFLTLKNSPVLNKYNFIYKNDKLTFTYQDKELLSISPSKIEERDLLSKKLIEMENSLVNPTYLLKNSEFPFYDTTHSNNLFNSISLINLNSIKDFENKISKEVESQRFRANIYVDGIGAWEERNWVNQIIKINNIDFKVEKNIPRCVAINIKPNTDDNTFNLLQSLKKNFNHFDMGIYLTALNDGEINIENKVEFNK